MFDEQFFEMWPNGQTLCLIRKFQILTMFDRLARAFTLSKTNYEKEDVGKGIAL